MENTNFKAPKNVIFDHNADQNFEDFLGSFNIYMKATGLAEKNGETRVAILLNIAGEEAQKKFKTFKLTEEQKKDYQTVIDAFKRYCKPLRNETYDRYKFFTRIQQEGEDFDNFLTDVKMLATQCNFGELEDSLVRDKIVSGILDLNVQERLLQRGDLTLKNAEACCRAAEISKYQVKDLRNEKEVDVIMKKKVAGTKKTGENSKSNDSNKVYDCLKCGRKHGQRNCPAFGKSCSICNKPNHFAVGCKLKNRNNNNQGQNNKFKNKIHEVGDDETEDEIYIDSIMIDNVMKVVIRIECGLWTQ